MFREYFLNLAQLKLSKENLILVGDQLQCAVAVLTGAAVTHLTLC